MQKKNFFDKPGNVNKLLRVFWGVLLALLVIDFFISKHLHFSWENWPGFYAAFGFVAFVGLILVAKYILRPLVKRKEDYYD